MPTTKPRITITATGRVAEILAIEAKLHPELTPSQLVMRLIELGHDAARTVSPDQRRDRVEALGGGIEFPPNYLAELRDDWPS